MFSRQNNMAARDGGLPRSGSAAATAFAASDSECRTGRAAERHPVGGSVMPHADLLAALLPPRSYDAAGPHVAASLMMEGRELDRVQADAAQAVGGLRPFTWQQWIEDYERVYGLPGPCAKAGQLRQERFALLAVALQERGGISLAWLKRYAALAGYEVDIIEYRPFRAGAQPRRGRPDQRGLDLRLPRGGRRGNAARLPGRTVRCGRGPADVGRLSSGMHHQLAQARAYRGPCGLQGGVMHRIDTATATPDNRFTEGDPTIPVAATVVSADWLNAVQEELAAVITGAGLELDKADNAQLRQAISQAITAAKPGLATTTAPGLVQIGGGLAVTPAGAAFRTAGQRLAGGHRPAGGHPVRLHDAGPHLQCRQDGHREPACRRQCARGRHHRLFRDIWRRGQPLPPSPPDGAEPDTSWCLCDGTTTNGLPVPDLRGRMIMGASDAYAAGSTGGSATHAHVFSGTVGATTLSEGAAGGAYPLRQQPPCADGRGKYRYGANNQLIKQCGHTGNACGRFSAPHPQPVRRIRAGLDAPAILRPGLHHARRLRGKTKETAMWFELTPHGMREISEDEILARADQIKARREMDGPALYPWQIPGTGHYIPSPHNHTYGGCHVCCYRCPR